MAACFAGWAKPVQTGNGRVVLITGCDSGFGNMLAQSSIESGFRVVAACYTEEGAAKFASTKVSTVVVDLTTKDGVARTVEAARKACSSAGTNGLYALVNNAGLCLPGNIEWLAPAAYEKTMALNFHAPVALTYELLPDLKAARGRVVNITSVDGLVSLPTNAAYCASKHALEAYSDSLRCEMLPWNVKVVVIEPATMRTPMAMAFADGWHKSFKEAPEERKAVYGDEWADRCAAETRLGLEAAAADPAITVKALMEALLSPSPPTRMATGNMASFFFKPLSRLPDSARDFLLNKLLLSPGNLPLGLQPTRQLPPPGVVSHVTVSVKSLARSVPFYSKFGLTPLAESVDGQQFLSANAGLRNQPLLLLREAPDMQGHGPSWNAGMTRLCIYVSDMDKEVRRLSELGLEPMAPVVVDRVATIAAYYDPDKFVVYLLQFHGPIGLAVGLTRLYKGIRDPMLLHLTVNVTSAAVGMKEFEALGFKTVSDQNESQVGYKLLDAFNISPTTSKIHHIRLCKLPADSHFLATIMEWVTPKTEVTECVSLNSMSLSVESPAALDAALTAASDAGMRTEPAVRRKLPVFGDVLVGSAFVTGGGRIEFTAFGCPPQA